MPTSQIASNTPLTATTDASESDIDFPRLQARTGRFHYGQPAGFMGNTDGTRIAFIRSRSGTDSRGCIWIATLVDTDESGSGKTTERIVVDVAHPGGSAAADVPAAERARRERLRESGSGVTAFSANSDLTLFCFTLGGSLFVAETAAGTDGEFAIRMLDVPGPVVDPRLSPDGNQVAWVAEDSVFVAPISGGSGNSKSEYINGVLLITKTQTPAQTVGLANFLAAEEFSRFRGFWWSPDSSKLLVEEVDSSNVELWEIPSSDSSESTIDLAEKSPRKVRYPAAGTQNPVVSLSIYDLTDMLKGDPVSGKRVHWNPDFEYLTQVSWTLESGPIISVMNRTQDQCQILAIEPDSGETVQLDSGQDQRWFENASGTPLALTSGQLVVTGSGAAAGTIVISSSATSGGVDLAGYLLRTVYGEVEVAGQPALLLGVHRDSSENQLAIVPLDPATAQPGELKLLTTNEAWYSAWIVGGDRLVISHSTINSVVTEFTWAQLDKSGIQTLAPITNSAEIPPVDLRLERHLVGPSELNTTVQWPTGHTPGSSRLPVILNPYGGPHSQRVVQSGRAFTETQWLADQGFCVIVSDVRGATGRSYEDQRTFYRNVTDGPLADQVAVVDWAVATWPDDIDPARVGIMGWSFGGYLAALAVLRRPDVFTAAIAGAPVTDWRLYDTAYTERYLGHPKQEPTVYEHASLLPLAADLSRPLLIIHGLSDDNVFFEHSRLLSQELTKANKAHQLVPLANVTHMTPQEDVAANLLALQLDFFRENL